jgi:hypothetical protein
LLVLFTFTLWWATRALVVGAEETAERQLRAYVWTSTEPLPNLTATPSVHTLIRNSGQTPAYKVRSWTETEPLPVPLPANYIFEEAPAIFPGDGFTINPDSVSHNLSTKDDPPLTQEEINAVNDGHLNLYHWGEVRYEDAFGHARYCKFRLARLILWPNSGRLAILRRRQSVQLALSPPVAACHVGI